MSRIGDLLKYVGITGSTVADTPGSTTPNPSNLRRVRVDNDGHLQVDVLGIVGMSDVNIAEVKGTVTVEGGVAGALGVGGLAPDGASVTGHPNLIAGSDGANVRTLQTLTTGVLKQDLDSIQGTTVVGTGVSGMMPAAGDVASGAAASSSYPVKIGAIVDEVLSTLTDGNITSLLTDTVGALWVRTRGYDSLLDAIKVAVQNTIADDRDEDPQTIADVTDLATTGTQVNYPSDDGIEIGNRDFLSMVYRLNDVTSVAIDVSNDRTIWVPATGGATRVGDGVNAAGNASTIFTSAAGTDTDFALDWEKCGYKYVRWGVEVPNATNSFEITLYQRAH